MDKTDEIRRINLEISLKFGRIEAQFTKAGNIAGLFERLFSSIEEEFAVPFIWLTLLDVSAAAPIIAALKDSKPLRNKFSVISKSTFESIIPSGRQPVLVNKNLQPYYKLLPPANKYFVKSLAVVPFTIQEEIVGSWNNGAAAADRYLPDMETGLLQKVAQKLSARLTELVSPV